MESYAQLVSLIVLIPAVGAIINIFWGAKLGEKASATLATAASALAFAIAVLLLFFLQGNHYQGAVINFPFFDGWIRLADGSIEIPWQMRVDTLNVTMMLVITGVGTLIHLYSIGYMHGDPRFSRFFAYLNMFLAFMLILVTGNNFLMLFVGWEGVGVCSFVLIGFWFDKAHGVGWRNSLAARKAFILNRVGDFGLLMAMFLTFWTFGTLDFYKPGEIANPHALEVLVSGGGHGDEASHGEEATDDHATDEHSSTIVLVAFQHGEEEGAEDHGTSGVEYLNNDHIPTDQLGVFGQAERFMEEGREVDFGPFTLPIQSVITIIGLFLFLGAAGKSAQIPLFVWLPDAMAGPTPVSALMHAATMVTAGVYLLVRSNVFLEFAPTASLVITLVGAATAFFAGYMAMGQWDIKRVLAYSTVSQLGFMVTAVGVGAYGAAMFHLVTHAFFKALLFLGSGSVIHGMEHGHHHASHHHGHDDDHGHHEEFDAQDMRNMGGLRRRMPITYLTYVVGTLALAGIFPFAGFWSKDEILADSWVAGLNFDVGGYIAFGILLVSAAMTAFYMWRQVVLVFHGGPRTEAADHAPESVWTMTVPLIILAVLSFGAGFLNTPSFLGLDNIFGAHRFTDWFSHSVANAHAGTFQLLIALLATALAVAAMVVANRIYGAKSADIILEGKDPLEVNPSTSAIWSFANARMYWDRTYSRLFEQPFNKLAVFFADKLDWDFWHDYVHDTVIWKGFNSVAHFLSNPVDLGLIDGIVNGVGRLAQGIAGRLRHTQTGYVRMYAVTLVLGVVVVIILLLVPLLQRG